MCGLIALRGAMADALHTRARLGLDAVARRGPDGEGLVRLDDPVPTVLGHRRLSILDPTPASEQPMRCPDTGNILLFNGAIYNFLELRRELEALGHVFRSEGDTEVLLHGWRVWGDGLFARCNGMWAIVLFDQASGDLVCCRDRLGVKPLYLHRDGPFLALASEIRAIAAMIGGYPAPNPRAIFDFLTVGISDHGPETFFDGIRALPAGQVWRITPDGRATGRPYHEWPAAGGGDLPPEETYALVRDATWLRLRSDVPTVTLLSGGLDSSILTGLSLAAGHQPRTCFAGAFTYGYGDPALAAYDETAPAAALMEALGHADLHHVHRAAAVPTADELMDLVATQEEPFCTPSILASFRMYRAIRAAGHKVVLSGEGSDELFGGYVRLYLALAARDALHAGQLGALAGLWRKRAFAPGLLLNRLAWDLPPAILGGLLRRRRPSVGIMARALWRDHRARLEIWRDDRRAPVEMRMRRDMLATNLPMVLRMTDRNSMRFGIEVRSPFIDHRLVARALAVPADRRMGDYHGKALLRRAFAGHLPDQTLWQRKSTGFGHAEQFLVDRMPLRGLLEDMPATIDTVLDMPRLRTALARGGGHSTLWLAVSLALWYRSIYG